MDLLDLSALLELLAADLGMMFPIAGVDGLDGGTESVEVVQFSDSHNFCRLGPIDLAALIGSFRLHK